MNIAQTKAVLLLEDGTIFYGNASGSIGTTSGELCFNTGMTGYQEVFTDPSYFKQILVMTNSHIGNYGIHESEKESDSIKISGLITKRFNIPFSRKLSYQTTQGFLEEHAVVGITDLDTRAVVRHIRNKGAMNAIISSEITDIETLKEMLSQVPSMNGLELSSQVTTQQAYTLGNPDATTKISVLDLGVKRNILNCFEERDTYLKVFPATATFEEMQDWQADAYFLSNGPGDPSAMPYAIETAKKIILSEKPLFGICLGHQILALSQGIKTYKMHCGHRGLNHPVKNLIKGTCEITSQNHGFTVDEEDVKNARNVEVTHINLNDGSIEGIKLNNAPAFSVQYHPESSPGPHDSRYLFDDFLQLIYK